MERPASHRAVESSAQRQVSWGCSSAQASLSPAYSWNANCPVATTSGATLAAIPHRVEDFLVPIAVVISGCPETKSREMDPIPFQTILLYQDAG